MLTYQGHRTLARLLGGVDDNIPTHVYGRYGENDTDIETGNFNPLNDIRSVDRDDFIATNSTSGGVRVPIIATTVESSGGDYVENVVVYSFTISRPADVGVNFTDNSYFSYLGLAVAIDTNPVYDRIISVQTIGVASRFGITSGGNIQLDYEFTFENPV